MKSDEELEEEETNQVIERGEQAIELMKIAIQTRPEIKLILFLFPLWCLLVPMLALLKWAVRQGKKND